MQYPKRLIEVDLPIARISAHARREKSIRHGHISTLHIWWARRPLAACRAVICASLWPDPADPLCPQKFRDDAARIIVAFAEKVVGGGKIEGRSLLETSSPESIARWEAIANSGIPLDPTDEAHQNVLRFALLDFIADFANWDNSTIPAYLETSRALTQSAHESLGGEPGTRPLVVDPFAGGGSIPLESLRVGADAFASDLNPVAVLLNKLVLEYVPKYGKRLVEAVRKWGELVQKRAEIELAHFYPVAQDGAFPLAYLWARTIISEAPDTDADPVEIPMMRSMWLAKGSNANRALRWVRDERGTAISEVVDIVQADGKRMRVRRPLIEVFTPRRSTDVETGTVARGSVTCPVTGYTTPVASVRRQLQERRGGASDARLLAVRQSNTATNDREWRPPFANDIDAVMAAAATMMRAGESSAGAFSAVPNEPLPAQGTLGFRVQLYGMLRWGDLFTPRQLLSLTTLCRLVNEAAEEMRADEEAGLAFAVQSILALAIGRLTDFTSSLCVMKAMGNRGVVHTFGRQALPVVWDFAETNPLNLSSASWMNMIDYLERAIVPLCVINQVGEAQMASATKHPLFDDYASAFITDPPYYDSVPYSDLSDYFYVWLRRALPATAEFSGRLTPKDDECIVDKSKGKDNAYYEKAMSLAMAEGRRVLAPHGIGVVVFAHKSTSGWEAQLQAIVDAGWIITGSWPIDTEQPTRLRAHDSAALASSVHLVCRPRDNTGASVTTDEIGEWRDVLAQLPKRIHEWMPRLAAEGVVGADAIFACLGPALEIFSRFSRVEKSNGGKAELREYLEHVWAAVSTEALSLIFRDADAAGLEPDARLTAMWLWTLGGGSPGPNGNGKKNLTAEDTESADEESADSEDDETVAKPAKSTGYVLEYDAARKIAQGLGVHLEKSESIVEVKGDKARLLPVAERTGYLFGKHEASGAPKGGRKNKKAKQKSLFAELGEAEAAEAGWSDLKGPPPGTTALDRLHQTMILFAAGRGEAMKRFLVDNGVGADPRFWKLAQSLSALYPPGTDEKRWVDGVLARKKGLGL